MKNLFHFLGGIVLIIIIHSCKKDKPSPPVVTTTTVTEISFTTATSGGNATNEGGATIISKGVCWSTSATPTIDNNLTTESGGLGAFTSNLTQLIQNTLYYVRAYATNSAGTGYGNQIAFTTGQIAVPVLTTTGITSITQTTAVSGGNITADNGGSVTARGVCWSTVTNPTTADSKTTDGTDKGSFVSNLTGLVGNTTYYVRAYATNSVGTGYGTEVEFKTIPILITDIDGNVYHTVIIGSQVWLVENLKTTKYRNGDAIPLISDNSEWSALTTGAYSNYSNDPANSTIYGYLYNWFTIADIRNIAPPGWHIPTEVEWTSLNNYLGGELNAGGKLKEIGILHWHSPNTGATNETGFTALPGGYRRDDGTYSNNMGYMGVWWSASEKTTNDAYTLFMYFDGAELHGEPDNKNLGFSIRCVMD